MPSANDDSVSGHDEQNDPCGHGLAAVNSACAGARGLGHPDHSLVLSRVRRGLLVLTFVRIAD